MKTLLYIVILFIALYWTVGKLSDSLRSTASKPACVDVGKVRL